MKWSGTWLEYHLMGEENCYVPFIGNYHRKLVYERKDLSHFSFFSSLRLSTSLLHLPFFFLCRVFMWSITKYNLCCSPVTISYAANLSKWLATKLECVACHPRGRSAAPNSKDCPIMAKPVLFSANRTLGACIKSEFICNISVWFTPLKIKHRKKRTKGKRKKFLKKMRH